MHECERKKFSEVRVASEVKAKRMLASLSNNNTEFPSAGKLILEHSRVLDTELTPKN